MRRQGVDTSADHVYPDLAFGLPGAVGQARRRADRRHRPDGLPRHQRRRPRPADEIHAAYVEKMKSFTRWLVDNGRRVRLFVGDTNNADEPVVEEILADIRAHRPDLDPDWVVAEPVTTFADLMRAMAPVGTVVATRYHNVICALMLAKPTISIGYGEKNAVLMAGTGLADTASRSTPWTWIGSSSNSRTWKAMRRSYGRGSPRATGRRRRSSSVSSRNCPRCSSRHLLQLRPWPSGGRPSASPPEMRNGTYCIGSPGPLRRPDL